MEEVIVTNKNKKHYTFIAPRSASNTNILLLPLPTTIQILIKHDGSTMYYILVMVQSKCKKIAMIACQYIARMQ